jgi:steroid delta-isomerase-like uncharacterized protein
MKKTIMTTTSAVLLLTVLAGCGWSMRERNKAIARRTFAEVLSEGHFERASGLYAPDFVNHGLHRNASLAEDQAAARGWKQAFPDLNYTLEQVIAEGDTVAVLWVAKGTNTGEGNGLPATGRKGALRGVTIWRIVDGKVHDEWSEFDSAQIALQLGLAQSAK